MQTIIVVGASVIVTAAVFVVLGRSVTQIGVESHIVTGQDGQTRETRSFNTWRSNTFAGRTIGIGRRSARWKSIRRDWTGQSRKIRSSVR